MREERKVLFPVRRPAVCAALLLLAGACGGEGERTPASVLRVGFVAAPGEHSAGARRGAELGAEEASRAGALIGRSFELRVAEAGTPEEVAEAARRLRGEGAFAIVGGFDEPSCRTLGELAEEEGFLFLNVGCRAEELRRARFRNTFHVEASDSMYRHLVAELLPVESPASPAVLWHSGLTRYGAAQLNDRFERRFGTSPDPAGWASWMAVKILAEAALRTGRTGAAELVAFLKGSDARFDGHKGEPLSFEPASHQLLQPLYLLSADAEGARSAPERSAASARTGEVPGEPAPPAVAGRRLAFVSNEGSGDITILDTETHRVLSTIRVGSRPRGIRVGPDGKRVYVALSDDAPTAESDRDAIAVIDLERMRVTARHPAGTDPEQFVVSPDGGLLYASNEDAGTASVTDLATGEVLATLLVGIEPEGVEVSPDGRWVYVTAETSNTVSVIDTREREVVASFLVDVRPRSAAFSPDGARAYVTNEISGTVSVVDPRAHRVVGTVELEERAKPVGVVVSPDGARVYVANGHAHSVSVIDAATDRMVASIPVGRRPWGIAMTPDGRHLYTANGGSDDVSVIEVATRRVVATIPVGKRPWGIAITP